ncbi:MAG: SPOR domain-containing protein [Thiotrichaceae bacterium]
MEKAVVRRGIGAVVLALVAALLLGYLLKGKGPERKEVVNMELPKSPIQIFPDGSATAGNDASKSGVVAATSSVVTGAVATGSKVAGAVKDGAKTTGKVVADAGKKLVGMGDGKDNPVDAKTGNPSLAKTNVVVDGSGQAVYGSKTAGVKNTPANFEFRTPGKREMRPSIDGRLTLKATPKKTKKVVKTGTKYKLVNEKKLPAVGSKKARKVASSRNKSSVAKKTVKTTKKKTVKKKSSTTTAGRNKYVVQLLATSSASKANRLKATMAKEGYPSFVSTTKRSGKPIYRVRVGSYSGKSSAIKKQASMKRRYLQNPYVQSSIVVRN